SSQFRHRPGARVRLASDHASGKQAPAPPNRSRQVANRDTRVQPLPVRPFPQSPVWPRSIAQRTEKRPDWLAVCAVPSETRSSPIFPASREINREFWRFLQGVYKGAGAGEFVWRMGASALQYGQMVIRDVDAQVLVVGAGPVGLTLAMDLARRGIAVVVVERRYRGEPPSVKCNHVSARSM